MGCNKMGYNLFFKSVYASAHEAIIAVDSDLSLNHNQDIIEANAGLETT